MIRAAIPALLLVGTVTAMAQPAPAPAPAAPDYSKVEEVSTDLGKGLYAITGSGGNTTVAVGSKGLIVVDTQYAPLYDKLRAKITSISPKPILYVVNTHYHADHTSGNAAFHQNNSGVVLVAHPQVLERMRNPAPRPDGSPGAAVPAEALPTAPYSGNGTTLDVGGQTAQLTHPAPAHTDGDTILIFPGADVISTGDIVSSSTYPNIDVAAGGGIDGMIAGTDFVIAHADANTKIVPGHGHVMNKAEVQTYRDMLKTARDRIAKAKAGGMTEDQVAKAGLLADLDKTWLAPGNPLVVRFPINVYRSVK
jgi:glyoxylase-like metal-dependent hydrolase (beta-lactamase superfamily II)